jgi:dipeptidyl aminopeptidase/acylaminoacyl peptidase
MKTLLIFQILLWIVFPFENIAQPGFTIRQVMSSGFPENLTTSSSGDFAAWVQNKNGVRNIYISDGSKPSKRVTSYSMDDGQVINSLIFSPDHKFLYYVRGGAPNRSGEIPNPLSLPEKEKREIWRVDLNNDSLKLISEGSSPSLSHNGEILAFINRGQVWKAELSSEKKPVTFFSIRGRVGSLTWAPDDSKLAFVSNRPDHAFIGIYHLATNKIIYIDPSVDNDVAPVWAPDSKRIAFIRIPEESQTLPFMPWRSALPWSILVGDSELGTASEIWKAPEGPGSAFRFISASNQLFWAENDRLVFPWEGDGWTHLYSIKSDGSQIKLLTPGNSEVQFVSISKDRKFMFYSSNQEDIDRQHIWKVNVSNGKTEQLSKGEGIEWSPQPSASNNRLFILASGPTTPAYPAVLEKGKIKSLKPESDLSEFPVDRLVKPEQVIFSSVDGMQIHGQLFLPSDMKKGEKYPAVLFLHGGSRRQMLLGFHHRGYYHNAYAFNQYLASQGYIVLAVNYRSGIGYGMNFREALNYGARGASEFQDILGAGLYLRNRSDVDPGRIGLWGGSYGGFLTAMGLAKASDLFSAGVDLHGVHDWNVVIRNFRPDYDPAKTQEVARLAYESSPIAYVKDWKSSVLLIHGDDDRNVPFSETVDIVEALRKNNVYFEQLIFPDEVHGFLLHSSWIKAYSAAFDFFERKLKNQ